MAEIFGNNATRALCPYPCPGEIKLKGLPYELFCEGIIEDFALCNVCGRMFGQYHPLITKTFPKEVYDV